MTAIPPSTPIPASGTAAAAPATPAAGSTAVLTQLPEAVRTATPGSVITGTVVGRDNQGQTLLQTDAGVIGLRTAAQLAVGSQITLQLQAAGSQLQAVLLSAVAPKPGSATPTAPAPRPAAPAAAAPATTLAVSAGPVLTATVITPNTGGPLPNFATAPSPALPTSPAVPTPAGTPAAPASVARVPGAPPSTPPAPSLPGTPSAPTPLPSGTPGSSTPSLPTSSLVAQTVQTAAPSLSSAAATYAATPGATTPTPSSPTPPSAPAPSPATPAGATPSPTVATPAPPSTAAAAVPTPGSATPVATNPAAPTSAAPTPSPTLSSATPASPLQPAASGTAVQLRLVAAAPATPLAPNQVAGTVVGYAPGGQAVVDTPLGRLALPLPPGAPHPSAGTGLVFELLGLGTRPASTTPAAALPALGREWPTLKATMAAVADIDLPLARQILEINMPRLGSPRFLGQVMQYLASSTNVEARTLLGDTAVAMLESAGRRDILARLDAELRDMSRLNASSSEWRVFFVPILDVHELRQMRVFTRKKKGGKDKDRDGGRFVVEVEFDELGAMQIDGLVQKPRIDVILRSHVELPPGMQAGIADAFGRTCDASGLVGKIFFQATSTFPVSPLDEIAKGGPGLSV